MSEWQSLELVFMTLAKTFEAGIYIEHDTKLIVRTTPWSGQFF